MAAVATLLIAAGVRAQRDPEAAAPTLRWPWGPPPTSPGLGPITDAPPRGAIDAGLARGLLGARLGLAQSTLSVGQSDRHPDTHWQGGFAVGLNAEKALNGVLSLRPELALALKGAETALGDRGGNLNLWFVTFSPLLLARFGAATDRVRPFLGLGPFVGWRVHASAAFDGVTEPEPETPYRRLDLGTTFLVGLWFDAGPQAGLFSADFGLDAGLWNLAEEAYPPYAGDQTLRSLNFRLGLTWHFWSPGGP